MANRSVFPFSPLVPSVGSPTSHGRRTRVIFPPFPSSDVIPDKIAPSPLPLFAPRLSRIKSSFLLSVKGNQSFPFRWGTLTGVYTTLRPRLAEEVSFSRFDSRCPVPLVQPGSSPPVRITQRAFPLLSLDCSFSGQINGDDVSSSLGGRAFCGTESKPCFLPSFSRTQPIASWQGVLGRPSFWSPKGQYRSLPRFSLLLPPGPTMPIVG